MATGGKGEELAESRRILERVWRERDHSGRSFTARHKYAAEEKGETSSGLCIFLSAVLGVAPYFWFLSYIAVVKS